MNRGRIVLLDHVNFESQLLGLVSRGGKINYPNGEHDDYANATAGCLYLASEGKAFNPGALPIGVGNRTFASEQAKAFGSTLGRSPGTAWLNSFGDDDDEPPAKVHEVFRFRWGWGE